MSILFGKRASASLRKRLRSVGRMGCSWWLGHRNNERTKPQTESSPSEPRTRVRRLSPAASQAAPDDREGEVPMLTILLIVLLILLLGGGGYYGYGRWGGPGLGGVVGLVIVVFVVLLIAGALPGIYHY